MMMAPRDPLVVLTAEQLRSIVSEAVDTALTKVGAYNDHDVMNLEHVAELLGVSTKTVRKMVTAEGLPTLRKVGKLWRFSRKEVQGWLAKRKAG